MKTFVEFIIETILALFGRPEPEELETVKIIKPTPQPMQPTNAEKLYEAAKARLDVPLTLDESVPIEVRCAEAVSTVFKAIGLPVPEKGIASTFDMEVWLAKCGLFEEIYTPEKACIIIAATGTGNGRIRGHVGIMGEFGLAFYQDWGIMSNDSNTGLFTELFSLAKWIARYNGIGGFKTRFYRLK